MEEPKTAHRHVPGMGLYIIVNRVAPVSKKKLQGSKGDSPSRAEAIS